LFLQKNFEQPYFLSTAIRRVQSGISSWANEGWQDMVYQQTYTCVSREILTQPAVRIFIRAPLLQALRVTKIDLHLRIDRQSFMLDQFHP